MIYEVRTSDFKNRCGNCKFFNTENHIDGKCTNLENKLKPWNRQRSYNSRACTHKEVCNK